MILLVSDLHLGKKPETDQVSLAELRTCIESFAPEVKHVVFLGDTFDAFVEYPGRIPRSVGLWTQLAHDLQESGMEVSYFQGNHDRWHDSYIEHALGIPVHKKSVLLSYQGLRLWLEHGDMSFPHRRSIRLGRVLTDHRLSFLIYRFVLPFGLGHRLAAWVSRTYSNSEPDPETAELMRHYALSLLKSDKADMVAMGHCHTASLARSSFGIYANTGDWYTGRTFVTLSDRVSLFKWRGKSSELVLEVDFSSNDNISGASDV